MDALNGKDGTTPLRYVIREGFPPIMEGLSEAERKIWAAQHTGSMFQHDNRTVYQILKNLTLDTEAHSWLLNAPAGDGRNAWRTIREHYENPGNTNIKVSSAEAEFEGLHYQNEAAFSFEKYITRMRDCYRRLAEAGEERTDRMKINVGPIGQRQKMIAMHAALGHCSSYHRGSCNSLYWIVLFCS